MSLFWYSWGDRRNPVVLMLQGMSSHGWWGAVGGGALAQMLVQKGYYVVSFDNRDIGRSTPFPDCPLPGKLMLIMTKFGFRVRFPPPPSRGIVFAPFCTISHWI